MMEILLHTCCAPCLIYPLERLIDKGFKVKAFYYNPNIHPFSEYNRRKEAFKGLSKELQLEVQCSEYRPSDFFQAVNPVRGRTPKVSDGCLRQPASNGARDQ